MGNTRKESKISPKVRGFSFKLTLISVVVGVYSNSARIMKHSVSLRYSPCCYSYLYIQSEFGRMPGTYHWAIGDTITHSHSLSFTILVTGLNRNGKVRKPKPQTGRSCMGPQSFLHDLCAQASMNLSQILVADIWMILDQLTCTVALSTAGSPRTWQGWWLLNVDTGYGERTATEVERGGDGKWVCVREA